MTRDFKLNKLLFGLSYVYVRELKGESVAEVPTIDWLCKTLKLETEEWEEKHLEQRLISDEYIVKNVNETIQITEQGLEFIRVGGYSKSEKDRKLDEEIKMETLKSLRRSKKSLFISILAMIGSIGAFLVAFFK